MCGPGAEAGVDHSAGDGDVPVDVRELLVAAYGADEFGAVGHGLQGHVVVTPEDVAQAHERGSGSSLLYGELLPSGVARLLGTLPPRGLILELGMGTGKVALQLFLSSSVDVYGVELSRERWLLGCVALERLAAAAPERFAFERVADDHSRLTTAGRCCDFVAGSLLDVAPDLLAAASAVLLLVCLPSGPQRQAADLLRPAATGCRVVCYAALHGVAEGCRLAPSGDAAALVLPTSWTPSRGHSFASYVVAGSSSEAAASWAGVERVAARGHPKSVGASNCDELLWQSAEEWRVGDAVLVGYSFLPLPDLGDPGDGTAEWFQAWVTSVRPSGRVDVLYAEDGTVEEEVHPGRLSRSVAT